MHVPDGFLDAKTALAAGLLSVVGLGLALSRVRRRFPARRIPLIGLAAAFVFVVQLLNFPVAGGTSGHLIGGVLAAVLLGGSGAVLALGTVVILQCLMFADGGLTALGANLFDLALVAPVVGYGVYRLVRRAAGDHLRGRLVAAGFAGWCSSVAAAVACAGQLALSGTVAWRVGLPAMAGSHMVVGLGEALITVLVVAAVARARPELLHEPDPAEGWRRSADVAAYGLLVAVGLAVFVAPFASPWPDALERLSASLGLVAKAAPLPGGPPLADRLARSLGGGAGATALVGGLGAAAAFGVSWVAARVLTPRGERASARGARAGAPRA